MKLNTSNWKPFEFPEIFDIKKGFYNKKPEFNTGGNIPFLGATDKNHGITGYFTTDEIAASTKTGNDKNSPLDKKIFPPNAICVTNNGSVGYAYYIDQKFTCSHDINPLYRKHGTFNKYTGNFVAAVIMKNQYRWGYGRKWRPARMKHSILKLPVKLDQSGKPFIDQNKPYSKKGYIPDWDFMESYIKSLNYQLPETKNISSTQKLGTNNWKEFLLPELFHTQMGSKVDSITTSHNKPQYNYVSRNQNNNGVVDFIDRISGKDPFPAGLMTISLGGSYLGSCFIQDKPFYTAQNVGVLSPKTNISLYSKLFIATIIRNECKLKYQGFGRELNSHFQKDFSLKLPIQRDSNGTPIIDNSHTFSKQGYIPDWYFMESYINSLPNGDLI